MRVRKQSCRTELSFCDAYQARMLRFVSQTIWSSGVCYFGRHCDTIRSVICVVAVCMDATSRPRLSKCR